MLVSFLTSGLFLFELHGEVENIDKLVIVLRSVPVESPILTLIKN